LPPGADHSPSKLALGPSRLQPAVISASVRAVAAADGCRAWVQSPISGSIMSPRRKASTTSISTPELAHTGRQQRNARHELRDRYHRARRGAANHASRHGPCRCNSSRGLTSWRGHASGRSVERIPECVHGRCSEKRAIRSSLLPTQMSSPDVSQAHRPWRANRVGAACRAPRRGCARGRHVPRTPLHMGIVRPRPGESPWGILPCQATPNTRPVPSRPDRTARRDGR
jgi:hypothetical protein